MSHNYQDRIVKGEVTQKGDRECGKRYEIIKKFLQQYKRPITILDLGAAQGYFSFKIAEDFDATCVMVESYESDTLKKLCEENDNDNTIFLNKHITPTMLEELSKCEHFDVVLALNVVHHIGDVERTMNALTKMCDHLIIETPPENDKGACGQQNITPILEYIKGTDSYELGTSKRHTSDTTSTISHIVCDNKYLQLPYFNAPPNVIPKEKDIEVISAFEQKKFKSRRKGEERDWIRGINFWTYHKLNGDFPPVNETLTELNKIKHKDKNPWNIIISGKHMEFIDLDDPEHEIDVKDNLTPLIEHGREYVSKIIFKGNVFNPTGIATANRELLKELSKLTKVQTSDIWTNQYDVNEGLEYLNEPINPGEKSCTIFSEAPHFWRDGYGKPYAMFVHEGTKIPETWVPQINKVSKLFVPSEATKNLFKWNGVYIPIVVIPHGVSEIYKPNKKAKEGEEKENFIFLSVNSWTGKEGDRKGTELLVKAFDEEFKDENVLLLLKISTFFEIGKNYADIIKTLLGHDNPKIMINDQYVPEKELVQYYQKSDCFVAPTRGEGFGLTMANAMACGLPMIATKDVNSGHMDFCKKEFTYFIDSKETKQADLNFYVPGNMLAEPDFESLKKQMRYVYENQKEAGEKGMKGSKFVRENFSWKESAKKLMEELK